MERLTVKWTDKVYDTLDPVDILDNEYSKINYNKLLTKLGEYEDFEEIFRDKMTDTACEFLKDKEEFGKWLDRNKWITRKCDEWVRAEEQGLLLRLPCGIGADIYFIPSKTNYKLNILQGYPESNRVYHQNVEKISFTQYGWYLECDKDIEYATGQIFIDKSYKETWFLTQEEAEQKLKEDGEISIESIFCDDTAAIKEAYERFENCAKEHEQLAECLEELKTIKEI